MTTDDVVIQTIRNDLYRHLGSFPRSHIQRRRLSRAIRRSRDDVVIGLLEKLHVAAELVFGERIETIQTRAARYVRRGYIERELTRMLAEEITREIDNEILMKLNNFMPPVWDNRVDGDQC